MTLRMESEGIDLDRLRRRAAFYAERAGCFSDIKAALADFLQSELAQRLCRLSDEELSATLVTDIYKPRMHKVYAAHLRAVQVDFALNVRHTPFPLERMRREDAPLHGAFLAAAAAISRVRPLSDATRDVLRRYFHGFQASEEMVHRAREHGVAPISWQDIEGKPYAFASGTAESASNVETTLTQLLQHYTILAQVREIQRRRGLLIDRTERIANSLGKLAGIIGTLNAHLRAGKEAVFAGRRSTDRLYLLLQNAFCARALKGYSGTSSVYAVAQLDAALAAQGVAPQRRYDMLGPLVGTHAHEVMSIFGQLLAGHDDAASDAERGPVQVSALVAHLAFIRAAGSLEAATALADTFGTGAFIAAALAARLPPEVAADLSANCEGDIPEGATVFDLFRVWRLDSGDYETEAGRVVAAWEARARERKAAGLAPVHKPTLMHSNLDDVDHVVRMSQLPERIRPSVFAFGTLADGYLPFPLPGGGEETIGLTSVVMKAVQARPTGDRAESWRQSVPCAGKIGDGGKLEKAQVDPRMPEAQQEAVRHRMLRMSRRCDGLDGDKVAAELAAAYRCVVHCGAFG